MLSTILLVILSLVGVLGDVSHILEDHQRNLPSHGPYVFSYTAGYPGNVDRQHAEVSDGSGVVRGTYSYADPRHSVRTGDYVADKDGFHPVLNRDTQAKEDHYRLYAEIANDQARAYDDDERVHANIADAHARAYDDDARVHANIADAQARAYDDDARVHANIADAHAYAHSRATGQSPPRQTAAVRAATNSHARLFNAIAEQHARIADDRGQLQRDDGLQYEDRYY